MNDITSKGTSVKVLYIRSFKGMSKTYSDLQKTPSKRTTFASPAAKGWLPTSLFI